MASTWRSTESTTKATTPSRLGSAAKRGRCAAILKPDVSISRSLTENRKAFSVVCDVENSPVSLLAVLFMDGLEVGECACPHWDTPRHTIFDDSRLNGLRVTPFLFKPSDGTGGKFSFFYERKRQYHTQHGRFREHETGATLDCFEGLSCPALRSDCGI